MRDTFHWAPSLLGLAFVLGSTGCKDDQAKSKPDKPVEQKKASGPDEKVDEPDGSDPKAQVFASFGPYTPFPDWSTWCGSDPACAAPLIDAVSEQTARSRPTVRRHGWHLWASIWSALTVEGKRNDASEQRTNLYGTSGCWFSFADGQPACGGHYPIWMTWPNNGRPHPVGLAAAPDEAKPDGRTLLQINRSFGLADAADPDPTQQMTVNTTMNPLPAYAVPPLVLEKNCRISAADATQWLAAKNYQAISDACDAAGAANFFCDGQLCDGSAFVNEGNVMIATESLSAEGFQDIYDNQLDQSSVLTRLYAAKAGSIGSKIGPEFVSTKHMFWPVKACKPGVTLGEPGCRVRYGALPPWVPKNFRQISYATNADYLGYEMWGSVVAIDTCIGGAGECPAVDSASLVLDHVTIAGKDNPAIVTQNPAIYGVDQFVYVQISEEALQQQFTATDRGLLDQATIWAYGDQSNGFEAGDFLVVAAMHVNTKELPSWAFQSVWWSPMDDVSTDCPLDDYDHCFGQAAAYAATASPSSSDPNQYSGLSAQEIAAIDGRVGTSWRDHYLLTDSYGIRYQIDGTPVTIENYFERDAPKWATTGPSGEPLPLLPVSQNVYIEPVIHPLGTDCQNCHRRAGVPETSCKGDYAQGCGRASYQTAQCPSLLGDYGAPSSDPCMTTPWAWNQGGANHCKEVDGTKCDGEQAFPVLDTDLIWLIADGHFSWR